MIIKPTKKFYLGCLIIVFTALYFGSFHSYTFAIFLSMAGLLIFIDIELINLLIENKFALLGESEK